MDVENGKAVARALDRRAAEAMARHGPRILRVALGIVFVWFGLLKVVGASPVSDLVLATLPGPDAAWLVVTLGVVEVLVGLGLLFAVLLRAVLLVFWAQMLGTFLVLVLQPALSFQAGNPLLLTVEGEFVVKNLVLIAAGLVVGGTLAGRQAGEPAPRHRKPHVEPLS